MKKLLNILTIFAVTMFIISSCEKNTTTEDVSRITYYATLEVLGDPIVIVDKGANYVDAGVYAEQKGDDVTDQVVTTSTVNTSEAGVYSVTYEITNEDGFSVTDSRTVYVADPTPSIISTGVHTTAEGTQRFWFSTKAIVPFSGLKIVLLQTEPGVFYISDFMGGYYDQRAGYGPDYAMTGYFQLNGDNTITPISSYVNGWGDSMDYLTNSSVDPGTGQITYKLGYAGLMEFTIIIN